MKNLLALFLLLFHMPLFSMEMSLSRAQRLMIIRLHDTLEKGEYKVAEKKSLEELRELGDSFSNLPYKLRLAEVALLGAKERNAHATPAYIKAFNGIQYMQQRQLVEENLASLGQYIRQNKIYYQNALVLIDALEGLPESYGESLLSLRLSPFYQAVREQKTISSSDYDTIHEYLSFIAATFSSKPKYDSRYIEGELAGMFRGAELSNQMENMVLLRRLQLLAARSGRNRVRSQFALWHIYRSRGNINESMKYLPCDFPEKIAGERLSPHDSLIVRANCSFNLARTITFNYSEAMIKSQYAKLVKEEVSLYKEAPSEANYFLALAKFELERYLLKVKEARASFEKIKANEFRKASNLDEVVCDKAIELASVSDARLEEFDKCIERFNKVIENGLLSPNFLISHSAFNERNAALYFRNINDRKRAHEYSLRSLANIDKNRPPHGHLKSIIYITAAQSFFIEKDAKSALDLIEKTEAVIMGSDILPRLHKLLHMYKDLFKGQINKDEFRRRLMEAYAADPFLLKQNLVFLQRI